MILTEKSEDIYIYIYIPGGPKKRKGLGWYSEVVIKYLIKYVINSVIWLHLNQTENRYSERLIKG